MNLQLNNRSTVKLVLCNHSPFHIHYYYYYLCLFSRFALIVVVAIEPGQTMLFDRHTHWFILFSLFIFHSTSPPHNCPFRTFKRYFIYFIQAYWKSVFFSIRYCCMPTITLACVIEKCTQNLPVKRENQKTIGNAWRKNGNNRMRIAHGKKGWAKQIPVAVADFNLNDCLIAMPNRDTNAHTMNSTAHIPTQHQCTTTTTNIEFVGCVCFRVTLS